MTFHWELCDHHNTRTGAMYSLLISPLSPTYSRALLYTCQVEDAKIALILFGGKTSQITKDVLSDLHKLKSSASIDHCDLPDKLVASYVCKSNLTKAVNVQGDSVKYTRKNDDVRPFEAGGDTNLEHFSQKTDSSLFALGNHSKKRPHNIVLGRFFDYRLHDMLELGVDRYKGIKEFAKAATAVQIGNKVNLFLQPQR